MVAQLLGFLVLQGLRQGDHEDKASRGHISRPFFIKKKRVIDEHVLFARLEARS